MIPVEHQAFPVKSGSGRPYRQEEAVLNWDEQNRNGGDNVLVMGSYIFDTVLAQRWGARNKVCVPVFPSLFVTVTHNHSFLCPLFKIAFRLALSNG
jgi:hypothetical protein